MSVKISELTASSAVTSNDFIPVVDYESATTKRASAQQVLEYVTGSTFNNLNVMILTGSIITGSTGLFTTTTSSQALITGDLRVLGTASISQLNTIGQTSLLIGDKYITILSGGVDHTGINGSGFLWGTSSGPGETTGALGEHAHVLYDASRDALEIFPGLYVTGSTTLFDISGTTAHFTTITGMNISGVVGEFTTVSASNMNITGNLVLVGPVNLSEYADYAYIIYTSSYDKLVMFPGLYVSGNLTGSGHAKFNEVSGTTAQFTVISASIVSASSYIGPIGGGGGDVTAAGNNTFTGINTFNTNYITGSITGSNAKFTIITGSSINISGTSSADSTLKVGSFEMQPYSINNAWIGENTYFNGTSFIRRQSGSAGMFYFVGNEGQFRFADSDLAGTALTNFGNVQFKVNASGIVALGGTINFNNGNYSGATLLVSPTGSVINGNTTITGTLNVTSTTTLAAVSGTTAQFTVISASIISASSYVGPIGGGGTPGGTDTTIQFNSGSTFSGSSNLVWDYTNRNLIITGSLTVFTSSVSSGKSAIVVTGGLDTTSGDQIGSYFGFTTSGSDTFIPLGTAIELLPGFTGAARTFGLNVSNQAQGTITTPIATGGANVGGYLSAIGAGSGANIGGYYLASNSTNLNAAVLARTVNSGVGANVGILGYARNSSGVRTAGHFKIHSSITEFAHESAALIADNGDLSDPIFIAKDNGSEVFRIDNGGNVGIGTANPNAKLDISGDMTVSGNVSIVGATPLYVVRSTSATSYASSRWYNDQNNALRAVEFGYAGSSYPISTIANGAIGEAGYLTTTGPYKMQFGSNNTFAMLIDASQNIGIATTSPNAKLDVNGNTIITGTLNVTSAITGSTAYFSGSVGIGTNNPTNAKVHIKSDVSADLESENISTTGYGSLVARNNVGTFVQMFSAGSSAANTWLANNDGTGINRANTAGLRLSGGSALMYSAADNIDFHLGQNDTSRQIFKTNEVVFNEYAKNYDFRIEGASSTNLLFVSANVNRIGINKSSPNATLDVSGSVIISGSLTVTGSIFVSGSSIYGQVAELTSSTTNYTLVRQDSGKFLHMSSSSGMTLTVPSGLPVGFTVSFCQNGTGSISVVTGSGVTINNRQGHTKTAGVYAVASLICTGSNGYIFTGDTST